MSTIIFAGNLAADPEQRTTHTGRTVTTFRVVETVRRRGEDGWEDGEPNVHRVQAWGTLGEHVAASCGKGDPVVVTGSVRTSRWTDKDTGQERTAPFVAADEVGYSLRFHTVQATKAGAGSGPAAGEG